MSDAGEGPVHPSSFLTVLWRHKLLIVIGTALGVAVGFLTGTLQPATYTAESRVFLSSQSGFDALSDGQFTSDPSRYLDQQAALLTSGPLLTRALALGAPASGVEELGGSLEVAASAESDVLTVQGTAGEPTTAASRVDATIAAYREYQQAQVSSQLEAVEALSNADEKRLANQRAVIFGDGVELVEQASVTRSTSTLRDATVLGLVGALVCSGLALATHGRRSRRERGASGRRTSVAPDASDRADWDSPSPATGSERPRAASRTS